MVEIFLQVHESQVSFLTIPHTAIQRLSIRPFKWLRFVMFSICGTHGDLSVVPDGPPVDYNSTELADNVIYYYKPSGDFIFVDYNGSNDSDEDSDQGTSINQADSCDSFRQDVLQRDGPFCVITGSYAEDCDAVHLIPKRKGDEYIHKVLQDHHHLYGDTLPIYKIDAVENGVLLTKTLHLHLDGGSVAFVKTPNVSGLEPTDIPRFNKGPACMDYITLQRLQEPTRYNPAETECFIAFGFTQPFAAFAFGLNVDAVFQGTPPPAIITDYMFGVTAYNLWRSTKSIHSVVENYYRENYKNIPVPPSPPSDDTHSMDSMA